MCLFVLLGFCLVFTACGSSSQAPEELAGTWYMTGIEMTSLGQFYTLEDLAAQGIDANMTLTFTTADEVDVQGGVGGMVSGTAGYTLNGDTLTIDSPQGNVQYTARLTPEQQIHLETDNNIIAFTRNKPGESGIPVQSA